MLEFPEIKTERLLLRAWRDDDLEPFSALNADPRVMEHFPSTEGARAALRFGFERLGLDEIVSMTVPTNVRSWRVMERLGMTRSPDDDFDHPRVAEGHRLRRHVLYRLPRARWQSLATVPEAAARPTCRLW